VRPVPLYDALAVDYDRFVNWKGRLQHELPFFERLFERHGVRSVLDAACGTGHHAIALAQRGYRVLGTDLSSEMVRRARENAAAAGVDARFEVAGFGDAAALREQFDAVICLGNSLPHLLTSEAVSATLADFAAVLHPGGWLVVQNRNFDRVWAERERFMGPQSYKDGAGEWIFVRFYDFHEETITFNMVRLWRTGEAWSQSVEATELRPIFRSGLEAALAEAGFDHAVFYGGYDGVTFDSEQSGDLITVVRTAP
jgi:glycine/sarcosine N-methyltransferase